MPLDQANASVSFSYDLQKVGPFGAEELGPATQTFSLLNLDLDTFTQAILALFTVFAKYTITGDTSSGTPTVSNVSSFAQVAIGQRITGTGIPAGTYISSFDSGAGTITLSQNATATNVGTTLTCFNAPYGATANLASGGSLVSGTTYYYVITALGTQGNSTAETYISNEVNKTVSGGNLTIDLAWTAVQGATGYNIYRGTSAGSENVLVYTVPSIDGAAPATSFTDDGTYTTVSQSPPGSQPNTYIEFSVDSYTNQLDETFTAAYALTIVLFPTGSNATCVFGPGSTNGLTWIFGGDLTLTIGSCFFYSEPVPDVGSVGTATHITSSLKTFRITNNGKNTLSVNLCLLVAPP